MFRSSCATLVLVTMLVGCGESDLEIELGQKVADLTTELAGVKTNLESTTKQLSETTAALDASKAAVEQGANQLAELQLRLQSETAALQSRLESETTALGSQLDETRRSLEASKDRGRMLAGLVDTARQESTVAIASLKEDLGESVAKASSLGAALSGQRMQLSQGETMLNQAQSALSQTSNERDTLLAKLERVYNSLTHAKAGFEAASAKNRTLQKELADSRRVLEKRTAEGGKLNTDLARTTQRLRQSDEKARGLEADLSKTRGQLKAVNTRASKLAAELKSTSEALVNQSKRAKATSDALDAARKAGAAGEDRIVALKTRLQNETEKNARLEKEAKLQRAEAASQKAALERESVMIDSRRQQLLDVEAAFNKRLEANTQRWSTQQAEINSSWARISEQLGQEQKALKSMHEAFEAERGFLVMRINRLVGERDRLQAEVNGGWGEIDALRNQLGQARARLMKLQ